MCERGEKREFNRERKREREGGSLAARLRGHGGRRGRHRAWPGRRSPAARRLGHGRGSGPRPTWNRELGGKKVVREREEREKRVFGERVCVLLSRES